MKASVKIDLSIIVASFETRALLLRTLDSVRLAVAAQSELRIETIVVDNGSRDGSAEAVRAEFSESRLVACVRNRGFAAAMNAGMRLARGRVVLLLNSDVEIGSELLSLGVRLFDRRPRLGIAGPRLLHADGRPQRSVHRCPGWLTEFLPLDWLDRHTEQRAAEIGECVEVEALRGAALFLRRSMIEKVGGLSEAYFFFLEETEYCGRVRRAGFQIVFAPQLEAVHHLGASSKRRAPAATRIEYHRSLYRYLRREKGEALAIAVWGLRTLRGAGLLLGLALLWPFSARQRSRFSERGALFLWHLRGCPDSPDLAQALEADEASNTKAD